MTVGIFVTLVHYVDDIILIINNMNLLNKTKQMLSRHFEMKKFGNASFMLDIQLHHDRSQSIFDLFQRSYSKKVLKRFNMFTCSHVSTPIQKGMTFSKVQYPQNNNEGAKMKKIVNLKVKFTFNDKKKKKWNTYLITFSFV